MTELSRRSVPNRFIAAVTEPLVGTTATEHAVGVQCADGTSKMVVRDSLPSAISFMRSEEPTELCRAAVPNIRVDPYPMMHAVISRLHPSG